MNRLPTHRRTYLRLFPSLLAACLLLFALPAAAHAATPPLLRQFCPTGQAGGQCTGPGGVAVDPTSGEIYVSDSGNKRIAKFTSWGNFLRAWGWDAVQSGPDDTAPRNNIQGVTVDATSGSFEIFVLMSGHFGPAQSAPIPFNATAAQVQSAMEATGTPVYGAFSSGELAVSGPAGGPWTIEFTGDLANTDVGRIEATASTLTGGTANVTFETIQHGSNFEVCVPANEDVCKSGQQSPGTGGFANPEGVALDSAGDLYVVDGSNRRVQKFGPEAQFLLTFGGDVNKTKLEAAAPEAQRNLCPIDPGDVCQAGAEGTGNGRFGNWTRGSYISIDGRGTPTADDDVIYVGDEGRVQEFDAAGHYLADLPDPDKVLEAGGQVNSLAVEQGSGDVYLGFATGVVVPESKPGVFKLDPAGKAQCTIPAHDPSAIAVGSAGEVYVVEGAFAPETSREIARFNSSCGGREVLFGPEDASTQAVNQFTTNPTGIATSSACGIEGTDLIISNPNFFTSFVKLFGPPPQDLEPPCAPPPLIPPTVSDTYAVSVGAMGASVRAQVNPHFWNDATYRVQYATAACIEAEGWSAPCVTGQPSAPGVLFSEDVFDEARATKSIFLGATEALQPDTDYRYRFLAQSTGSAGAPVPGPEAALHTYPLPAPGKLDCPNQGTRGAASAYLPDCRAYEMVSPVEKNGSSIGLGGVTQASPDGRALTYTGPVFAEPESGPAGNQYIAERGAGGWATHSVNAPMSSVGLLVLEHLGSRYKALSEDLCSGWLLQDSNVALVAEAPAGVPNLYRRYGLRQGCPGSGYQLLTTVFPYDPKEASGWYWLNPEGFSADGEVSVFRAPAALTKDACHQPIEAGFGGGGGPEGSGIAQLYLSREGTPGVAPQLVSLLPNGQAPCTHSTVGTATGFASSFEGSVHHAVSDDGSRVYWTLTQSKRPTTNDYAGATGPGHLYLRLNAPQPQSTLSKAGNCTEAAKACTYPVSAEAEALSGTKASRFLDAAADGSVAYLSTGNDLTGEDLYEYDLAKALAKKPATTLIAHQTLSVLGASEDGSRLYLVSEENLDAGASAGKPNLYLYERGAGFSFIAILGAEDVGSFGPSGAVNSSRRLSRVSPDGLHAAFLSADPALAQATAGYDNTDSASGRPAREAYLYDATADEGQGKLVCASCNPSGARPRARLTEALNSDPDTWVYSAATIPGWITAFHPGNALSADGRRLFFESFEALTLRDTNGVADVYEWEAADGKAQCLEGIGGELYLPASEGCLSLISSGTGSADSQLIDATPSGEDVFIRTEASLLPQDPGLGDAYDARVGGGYPQPTVAAECEGEACQSPPAAPNDPTPASSSFQGAGNVVEAGKPRRRCPEGKRLAKSRGKRHCVARHPKAPAKRRSSR